MRSAKKNGFAVLLRTLGQQAAFAAALFFPQALLAQAPSPLDPQSEIGKLQQQIMQVQRESQQKLEELQKQTDQQMHELQRQIERLSADLALTNTEQASAESSDDATSHPAGWVDKLEVSGDFRLRYEANSSDGPIPSWDRGVLRGRFGAAYKLSDRVTLGGRIVTGDADNPRTSDTTIGSFNGDFDISLDQAYVAFTNNDLFLTGGKFAKPFISTELVWDGDVNPQGLGGHFEFFDTERSAARFAGIYFLINQSIFEKGSDMLGGQVSLDFRIQDNWNVSLSTAYYDYNIGLLNPTVPGGARGNNVTDDRLHYVSDFNLWDTVGTLSYNGFGDRWPVRLVADYVKNLGAEVSQDSGYGFDLFAGNLNQPGHFLFRYGYSQVETDAVLGMFSNDNIVYPTNYELHTFSVDYALREHTFVGLTSYLYRHLEWDAEAALYPNDWVSRTRLNLYFTF